ncbi:hypothetical protein CHUAL_012780 [Chamberlinius hualienensis]
MAPSWTQLLSNTQMKLYALTAIVSGFFVAELVLSHFTHSLTLLTDAYHTLFNVVLLIGFIITIKMTKENTLKNTFGWARIEVLGLLISILALTALCFSVFVEALQTFVHAGHSDAMHHPLEVMCTGVVGIALNLICFLTIGGVAHGTRTLNVNPGDVQVNVTVPEEIPCTGNILLSNKSTTEKTDVDEESVRQEILIDFFRDLSCSVMVTVSAGCVYTMEEHIAQYIDPALSILSVGILLATVYPFFKESGMILLQTVPSNIEVDHIKNKLMKKFPSITNVHHLHIWRLNRDKVIATVHIKFVSSTAYSNVNQDITDFFTNEGILLSTVQPEFENWDNPSLNSSTECVLRCRNGECKSRMCCKEEENANLIEVQSVNVTEETEPLSSTINQHSIGEIKIESRTDS